MLQPVKTHDTRQRLLVLSAYARRGPQTTRTKRRLPLNDCQTVDDVLQLAVENIDDLSHQSAAVWTFTSRLMTQRPTRSRAVTNQVSASEKEQQILLILDQTMKSVGSMKPKELTTIILGLSKIVQDVQGRRIDANQQAFWNVLLDDNSSPKESIFQLLAEAANDKLHRFDAQCLANLAYAHALLGYDPEFLDEETTLFANVADRSIECINTFEPQGISNLVWAYSTLKVPNPRLFQSVGDTVADMPNLDNFYPQALSNTVWAFAAANVPHRALFEKVVETIFELDDLSSFKPQALSNIVWAYATADMQHPDLFWRIGDVICDLADLRYFNPQALANIVWAFATANIRHLGLFNKVGEDVVRFRDLGTFKSQELANTFWAYATAEVQYPRLFHRIGEEVIATDALSSFKPQELSNTVWAFAKADIQHVDLFQRVGHAVVEFDGLQSFKAQELSNLVWAYATAKVQHADLFKQVADAVVDLDDMRYFTPQILSNLVWAYATANELDAGLFNKVADAIVELHDLESFSRHALANIAWSYAVANVDAPLLFNDAFTKAVVEKQDDVITEDLCQLYQWHLWRTKEKGTAGLPDKLQERCSEAFAVTDVVTSALQNDVVAVLTLIGLDPLEEFLTQSRYRIDAVVEIDGKKIGIEVDGPSHFIGRTANGKTLLKRRQVTAIDKISLVSVPYWDWDEFRSDQNNQQKYLTSLIQELVSSAGRSAPEESEISTTEDASSSQCDQEDLNSLTVPQLKEMLRIKGLKLGGRKAELIERLSGDL